MKSARTLIGLPVILECKPLGYICQATPDERLDHLERIYFSSGTGARMIERDQVDAIGEVAMLVHAPGKRAQLPESFWPRRAISTDGARLGAITDALIDEDTLEIHMLELSRGLFDDFSSGRVRIGRFSVRAGGEVVIDTPEGGEEA
ncbi:MAG: PRC-barrel domain-containing protein [Clostridiales bacterium]|nr:PRC-barrel domain-containing protein [Clostridiales bacterium]MDD7368387.1 PRC-barrel domain-containing protein [Clostridiales bacterium]MDY2873496.1 PRC-barrel domain-containing protein [Eubacteriales bacterium]